MRREIALRFPFLCPGSEDFFCYQEQGLVTYGQARRAGGLCPCQGQAVGSHTRARYFPGVPILLLLFPALAAAPAQRGFRWCTSSRRTLPASMLKPGSWELCPCHPLPGCSTATASSPGGELLQDQASASCIHIAAAKLGFAFTIVGPCRSLQPQAYARLVFWKGQYLVIKEAGGRTVRSSLKGVRLGSTIQLHKRCNKVSCSQKIIAEGDYNIIQYIIQYTFYNGLRAGC